MYITEHDTHCNSINGGKLIITILCCLCKAKDRKKIGNA